MKLTFILFAFVFNFFNPYYVKAEEIIDSTNNKIEDTSKVKSSRNQSTDIKKIHIVRVGDTITSISNFYSIDKDIIIKINDLKDENYIYVGQNLKISDFNQESTNNNDDDKNIFHIVQKGESLIEISTRYQLNFKDLIEINNLTNPDSLEIGSKLVLKNKNKINRNDTKPIKGKDINQVIIEDRKTYGPLTIQQNVLEKKSNRKVLNAINQNNKKIIISIKCETKDLDVRVPGRKWRGWMPAEEVFEKNLINDFC